MDLSDLPTIVIKVNIGCCESCPEKLGKLLEKKEGVESFDIDIEKGTVTIKGDVDPQILVKNIAKALKKKKTKLMHYELPKKEDSAEETDESHSTQEKIHSGTIEQHVHGSKETYPTHGDHGSTTDLHSSHHHSPNFNSHFNPAPLNPHYPPPRASPHHHPYDNVAPHHRPYDDVVPRHQPYDDMTPHHRPYYGGASGHQYECENPRGPVMAYPPNGNYMERPRHVSSTNSPCDYFSDENASSCAIM